MLTGGCVVPVSQIINANNVIPQVNAERPLFYREKAAQMYPSALYSISWGLAEVTYQQND